MISAAELAKPDLIICPFLTVRVPEEIHNNYLTLIIHPGPPGDAGPSSLDWVLCGGTGELTNTDELLKSLDGECSPGRTHWGVTVLQAMEEFDAGPVWAFEQFPIDIDEPGLTKSDLYRGPVTRAAIGACLAAVQRIKDAAGSDPISVNLKADPDFEIKSVALQQPFLGGPTHKYPLFKAKQRDFDVTRHTAQQISRRIRCGDSQPGVLSSIFGRNLYVYGGIIEQCPGGPNPGAFPNATPGTIVAIRRHAVCFQTVDGKGIWITHTRRPKGAQDPALWPKVPAVQGLLELNILQQSELKSLDWGLPNDWVKVPHSTFQEIWIDFVSHGPEWKRAAYLYFDFTNGAMSTDQCSYLIEAMDYILSKHSVQAPISAVVLMGGAYFSNGIALNVIESASNPSQESWDNINRIDDVVFHLLHSFKVANIMTVAAIRGNAAAGGVALAAACDIVIAGAEVVLNPAYRAVGLYGSEYHTISYYGRCGEAKAREILTAMTPISPYDARTIGLVDHVLPGHGFVLHQRIRNHVSVIVRSGNFGKVKCWKASADTSLGALAKARVAELGEMSRDFWSARSARYHSRRFAFVRKVKATKTPFRFAKHRRIDVTCVDEEETEAYDSVQAYERLHEAQLLATLQKQILDKDYDVTSEAGESYLAPPTPSSAVMAGSMEPVFNCYYSNQELEPPSGGMQKFSFVANEVH
jgi:enoyl-CoA hydratase/carnithine racemase